MSKENNKSIDWKIAGISAFTLFCAGSVITRGCVEYIYSAEIPQYENLIGAIDDETLMFRSTPDEIFYKSYEEAKKLCERKNLLFTPSGNAIVLCEKGTLNKDKVEKSNKYLYEIFHNGK